MVSWIIILISLCLLFRQGTISNNLSRELAIVTLWYVLPHLFLYERYKITSSCSIIEVLCNKFLLAANMSQRPQAREYTLRWEPLVAA